MVKEVNLTDMLDYAKEDFTTGFMCAETVLDTLNKFYELGIGDEAIAMATGIPYGFGNGGNVCGAVEGATLALGKIFGRTVKGEPCQKCLDLVRELNDEVIAVYNTTICPDLINGYEFKDPARKVFCTGIVYESIKAYAKIMERECGVTVIK